MLMSLSILFIFSKNQLLALLIFAMVSFVSFVFISALIFKIYFLLSRKIKSDTVSTVSPSISHEVVGLDAVIFVF